MRRFVRITTLKDIGGRADYITNEKKQEQILAQSAHINWQPYQDFENQNQKNSTPNNQGRELIIALPNAWAELPTNELQLRCQTLAELSTQKNTDLQWAMHWNKKRTNLHMHVIFSERSKTEDAGVWRYNVYLTDTGKVARKKSERAKNEDGTYKPPKHFKGEPKGKFTSKNNNYTSKTWLEKTKELLQTQMEERWNVKFDAPQLLHEYHEGKGSESAAIKEKNKIIRAANASIEKLPSEILLPQIRSKMVFIALEAMSVGKYTHFALETHINALRATTSYFEGMGYPLTLQSSINDCISCLECNLRALIKQETALKETPFFSRKVKRNLNSEISASKDVIIAHGKELKNMLKDLPATANITFPKEITYLSIFDFEAKLKKLFERNTSLIELPFKKEISTPARGSIQEKIESKKKHIKKPVNKKRWEHER